MPKPPTTKASHRAFTEQQPLLDPQQAKFDSKDQDNLEYQEQAQWTIEEQATSPEIGHCKPNVLGIFMLPSLSRLIFETLVVSLLFFALCLMQITESQFQ